MLTASGIQLVMISIGLPEKGRFLAEHLEINDLDTFLYVDPENTLYDALDLNKGLERTFFNINTPYAFLDRFRKKDGGKELWKVLGKYNKGKRSHWK